METLNDQIAPYIPRLLGERGRIQSNAALADLAGRRVAPVGGVPFGVENTFSRLSRPQRLLARGQHMAGRASGAVAGRANGLLGQLLSSDASSKPITMFGGGRIGSFLNRAPGVARGAGYGLAGNLAGSVLGGFLDSQGQGLLADIVQGAGPGAGLGAMFGLPGAVIGGIGGGLIGALAGDRGGAPQMTVPQIMSQKLTGLVPADELERARRLYEAYTGIGVDEETAINNAYGRIIEQLNQPQVTPDVLALQMATQALMQPIVDQARERFATYEQMMSDRIADLPAEYQPLFAATIPQAMFRQNQILDANMLAAQLAPVAETFRQQQQYAAGGYGNPLAQDPILSALVGG